jgi:hypothetical protein
LVYIADNVAITRVSGFSGLELSAESRAVRVYDKLILVYVNVIDSDCSRICADRFCSGRWKLISIMRACIKKTAIMSIPINLLIF